MVAFLLVPVWAFPQYLRGHEGIRFSGVVLDEATSRPLPDASCRRGDSLLFADAEGRFALHTKAGDTIRFTHVGYRPYEVVVPDSLAGDEYIMAVFITSDTVRLPEAVVRRRYGEIRRQYMRNARSNMRGVERDAFSPRLGNMPDQNQRRVLDEFAASTNKGHVNVGFGVGTGSVVAYKQLRRQGGEQSNIDPLGEEEVDLLKMLFQVEHKKGKNVEIEER